MRNPDRRGYIALARSFIKDIRFRRPANRPLTELEAMIWLICGVAWQPRALPTRFGAIHNDRGQLSTTQRELAREWSWSKSKVVRFLTELTAEGTVIIEFSRPGPTTRPETEAKRGYARTLITLGNYDKFQGIFQPKNQHLDQKPDQKTAELPGLLYAISASNQQEPKQAKISSKRQASKGGGFVGKPVPEHRKQTRDRLMIFCRYGSDEWRDYANDFAAKRGYQPTPTRYLDGRGNWFMRNGESQEITA